MKDKNLAGVLALFFGWLGIHRFYLGQVGWGIFYLFFFWFSFFLGLIDAIAFFSMSKEEFDRRYNKDTYKRNLIEQGDYYERRDYRQNRQQSYNQPERAPRRTPARQVPAREPEYQRAGRPPAHNPFRESGIKKFRDYDYDEAIVDFEKALELDPRDVATHFNLACAYSLNENKDKAFYHLDRAVAMGFDDWNRIKTHDALAYLRIQSDFEQFEANGFRLAAQLKPEPELQLNPTPQRVEITPPATEDLLEQLRRLGELREKGLLTEAEFATQKKKLLG